MEVQGSLGVMLIIFFTAMIQGMADIAAYRLNNPWSVIQPETRPAAGSSLPDECPCRGAAWNAALEKANHYGSEALH